LRRDLAIQALPEAVSQSVIVPRSVLEQVIRLQEQVRDVRELAFKPADFAAQVKPTDEELRKHYDANAAAYETPESAKVEYLVLSAKSIAEQITLSADDVRTYYEQNKARFTTAEERRASHILIAVDAGAGADARKVAREKAEKLLKQVRDGADFAALAKANSSDSGSAAQGGDLGYFARGAMVKSFADAAFALKDGEISDVVETEFGYHIIKLTGIKPGAVRSFDEVRKEIESDLRQQQAGAKFAETADAFSNMVYEQADSLKPAADRFGLTIQTAESLTRAGTDQPKDSPLANPKLLAAVFSPESIRTKRNSEAIEVGGNTLVSARVVEYRPAKRKPFESVQAEVRANVVDAEARKLAIAAGAKRLEELRAGGAATGFTEARGISRAAATTVPAQALDAVFKLTADKLPAYVGLDLGARGYSIYALVKVTDPSAEVIAQRRAAYEQQVAQAVGQQQVTDLIESLKARAKITRRLESAAAKTDTP
jgi:peptidyl-prolyl cis-trans isomerase D